MQRPEFKDIKSYDEFIKYYWYRDELIMICKELGINYIGNKQELNNTIKEYYNGVIIPKKKLTKVKENLNIELRLDTSLYKAGFVFNDRFRSFFIKETNNPKFKFTADMVETAKQVKQKKDIDFTLGDMLDIYYGKKTYAIYDKSSCQWNKFLKDFCSDSRTNKFKNKLAIATKLWKIVKESTLDKVYSTELLDKYNDVLECE